MDLGADEADVLEQKDELLLWIFLFFGSKSGACCGEAACFSRSFCLLAASQELRMAPELNAIALLWGSSLLL